MANKDLRDWISGVKAAGELKMIKGAEPREEIGAFVDIYQRKMGNLALLFDEVPGFPKASNHRQYLDLRAAHQPRARITSSGIRDGTHPMVAELYEECSHLTNPSR